MHIGTHGYVKRSRFMCLVMGFLILVRPSSFATEVSGQEMDLPQALAKLEAIKRVDGSAVGYSGTPGEFYILSETISAKGTDELFVKLLTSASAIKRCMGLYCISRSRNEASVHQIKMSLRDSDLVEYFPGGCIGFNISVGEFAFDLLLNRNALTFDEPHPLLSEAELSDISISVLANDRYYHLHQASRVALNAHLAVTDERLTLAALKERQPNIYMGTLLKAIGRLDPNPKFKALLLECALSKDSDTLSKMTAWSALTRYADQDVAIAVQNNLPQFDLLDQGFAKTIQSQLEVTQRHETQMGPIRRERTWMGMEAIKDKVILAYSLVNPIAVPDLSRSFGYAILDKEDVRATVAATLIAISQDKAKYVQSWSTYSCLPYQLRDIVRSQRLSLRRVLDEKACKAIEANL